jgi:uncharacterized SAM-binding protein YcdF (DUF218 family)
MRSPSGEPGARRVFFQLSKLFGFAATPSNFLTLLVVIGLLIALAARARRVGLGLAGLGAAGLFVGGLLPLSNWLILPLEERFPTFRDDGKPVDGVILLGGSFQAGESITRGQIAVADGGERIMAVSDLARRYPSARILISGGAANFVFTDPPEADAIARFAGALGLPRDRMTLENRSRTTAENAAYSRTLAEPKPEERWLLVTSAWHMPRAIGSFRQAGFPVTPYPVDFRTRGWGDATRVFLNVSEGLRRLDIAVKEWIGLAGYRLAGYTDALFPGPSNPPAAVGSASR